LFEFAEPKPTLQYHLEWCCNVTNNLFVKVNLRVRKYIILQSEDCKNFVSLFLCFMIGWKVAEFLIGCKKKQRNKETIRICERKKLQIFGKTAVCVNEW